MKKNKAEEVLRRAISVEIDEIKNIKVPDFNTMMKELVSEIESENSNTGNIEKQSYEKVGNLIILKKGAIIGIAVVVIGILSPLVFQPTKIDAFGRLLVKTVTIIRDNIIAISDRSKGAKNQPPIAMRDTEDTQELPSSKTMAEAELAAGYHIYTPQYIPEGYSLVDVSLINYENLYCEVDITYKDESNGFIKIKQRPLSIGQTGVSGINIKEDKCNIYTIDNYNVYFLKTKAKTRTGFWNNNDYRFDINTTIPEEEAIEVIKSMK